MHKQQELELHEELKQTFERLLLITKMSEYIADIANGIAGRRYMDITGGGITTNQLDIRGDYDKMANLMEFLIAIEVIYEDYFSEEKKRLHVS